MTRDERRQVREIAATQAEELAQVRAVRETLEALLVQLRAEPQRRPVLTLVEGGERDG